MRMCRVCYRARTVVHIMYSIRVPSSRSGSLQYCCYSSRRTVYKYCAHYGVHIYRMICMYDYCIYKMEPYVLRVMYEYVSITCAIVKYRMRTSTRSQYQSTTSSLPVDQVTRESKKVAPPSTVISLSLTHKYSPCPMHSRFLRYLALYQRSCVAYTEVRVGLQVVLYR